MLIESSQIVSPIKRTDQRDQVKKHFSLPLLAYIDKIVISDHYPLILFLEQQLSKNNDNGLIHEALAHLNLKEGKTLAAIKHLEICVQSIDDFANFGLLATLLEQEGRSEESASYYRQGLLLATGSTTAVTLT